MVFIRRLCSHSASWHRSPRHLLSILSCVCGRIFLCSLLFWHSYGACLWLASLFKLQICVQHHSWALLLPELIRVLQVTAFMKMFLLFCTKYPIPRLLARILLSALSPKALRHQWRQTVSTIIRLKHRRKAIHFLLSQLGPLSHSPPRLLCGVCNGSMFLLKHLGLGCCMHAR